LALRLEYRNLRYLIRALSMSRRLPVHVLLSLLLLISQLMAGTHAYTHWPSAPQLAAAAQAAEGNDEASKSLASDHGCGLCLTAANLASALASPSYALFAEGGSHAAAAAPAALAPALPTALAYRSRAPPQA
jgi:hypothetical protein